MEYFLFPASFTSQQDLDRTEPLEVSRVNKEFYLLASLKMLLIKKSQNICLFILVGEYSETKFKNMLIFISKKYIHLQFFVTLWNSGLAKIRVSCKRKAEPVCLKKTGFIGFFGLFTK